MVKNADDRHCTLRFKLLQHTLNLYLQSAGPFRNIFHHLFVVNLRLVRRTVDKVIQYSLISVIYCSSTRCYLSPTSPLQLQHLFCNPSNGLIHCWLFHNLEIFEISPDPSGVTCLLKVLCMFSPLCVNLDLLFDLHFV